MDPSAPLVFASGGHLSTLSRAVGRGLARRLARGLYTYDLLTEPAVLIRRHWLEATAYYFPDAIITDRSRPRSLPDGQGFLFVVHERTRPVILPGLTIVPRPGAAPLPDDIRLPHGLYLSSLARGLLENLLPSRASKHRPRRTLTTRELHDWLVQLLRTEGITGLNRIRDRARTLAEELGWTELFPRLDAAIGAALGTREVETDSPGLTAASRGRAFDERRDALFSALARHLASRAPVVRSALEVDRPRRATLPFFEAYFSNFIEGTEFTVDEAAHIVLEGVIPSARPEDAHDILGTYAVVSDAEEMRTVAQTADELLSLLQRRHGRILSGRPDKHPGELKQRANRAGSTEFVAPELVRGTLARGFEQLRTLEDPFARAVFMMFLVSEVHPFDDGNGRVARVMMNAELEAAGEHRILIPTVFRTEYLASLRALTHNLRPEPLTRVLDFAQRFTAQMDFSTLTVARSLLERTNAFVDPAEALDRGLRLLLPSALSMAPREGPTE